jgi:predicted secreted protein
MVMERGQFVASARTGSLEASTEATSATTKYDAPTTVVTAWRLRAIGGATACPIS